MRKQRIETEDGSRLQLVGGGVQLNERKINV